MNKFLLFCLVFMPHSFLSAASGIEVQGHRGARTVLPENTLPAFLYALEIGVDTLELDMGVTKDGIVVVSHDQKINDTICQYKDGSPIEGDLWIRDLSLMDIKAIDCGSKANPRFPNQTLMPGSEIPTLDEVFKLITESELANSATVLFNIETKSDENNASAQPEPEEFVKLVLELVNKYQLQDRVTIQSFDHRTLIEAKQQAPNIQLAALFKHAPDNWIGATRRAQADIVSPDFELLSANDVKDIQAAGLRVIPWTANQTQQWEKLIEMGVDGIITDDPEPLLTLLGRR